MTDTLDAIRAYNTQRGPTCRAGVAFAAMDTDLKVTFQEAIDDPTIELKGLRNWLADQKGIDLPYSTLQRHARGDCRCE